MEIHKDEVTLRLLDAVRAVIDNYSSASNSSLPKRLITQLNVNLMLFEVHYPQFNELQEDGKWKILKESEMLKNEEH